MPCDVTDAVALEVAVHNAVGGAFGSFMYIDPVVVQHNFDIHTMALLRLTQLTTPVMVIAGEGALIVTGNTSALLMFEAS